MAISRKRGFCVVFTWGDPMDWSADSLFAKAKIFMSRANDCERDDALYPFWATLALELLARAALAHVNPALLADPSEGHNILYACGFPGDKQAKSISAKTLFMRCEVVVPGLTKDHVAACLLLSDRRNRELHTGAAAFEGLKPSEWLPDFLTSCDLLLTSMGRKLEDFIGADEAEPARQMLGIKLKEISERVRGAVRHHKDRFFRTEKADQERRKAGSTEALKQALHAFRHSTTRKCPACACLGIITGEVAGQSAPRVAHDGIEQSTTVMPTGFTCYCCGLSLTGYDELLGAGLGDHFSKREGIDPLEFFGIDPMDHVDPSDFYEPEYGND